MKEKQKHIKHSLKNLSKIPEDEIDYSDSPEVTDALFNKMVLFEPIEKKQQISIRLDKEIIEHFKATGKGYQSKINAVLREYVRHFKHP